MVQTNQWTIITTDLFDEWLIEQPLETRQSVLSTLNLLRTYGHSLSRPFADTVKNSKYANMKELRIKSKGKPIRAFFAFDTLRQAIVLCAGDKSNDKKFYEKMIRIADDEFTAYLQTLEK